MPSQRDSAAILNGSPPTLTIGVTKLREKPATVIAYVRQNGGRTGSPPLGSPPAPPLQADTPPQSMRIGANIQPPWAASAGSVPTPLRATPEANTPEAQ